MPKRTKKKPQWVLASETIDLGSRDGRHGYTDLVRTDAPAWDWYAEGGPLGPLEGTASTAAEARERVEQALGLPTGAFVLRARRATSRAR